MTVSALCGQFRSLFIQLFLIISFLFTNSCARATTRPGFSLPPPEVRTELSAKAVEPGRVSLLTLVLKEKPFQRTVLAEFNGNSFPFFPLSKTEDGTYGALLAIPYDEKLGSTTVKVQIGDGESITRFEIPLEIVEGHYGSERLKVDGSRVNPQQKKVLARIKREQSEVAEIYKKITPRRYWEGPFSLPIQSSITSAFGTKRIYNGKLKNFHPGLDLKASLRTPVNAAEGGVVVMAKSLFYTGYTVMIDHGYGIITLYAHLSQLKVKKGQVVSLGEVIGLSGKTGRVNGPHLHWQAVVNKVKVDPLGLTKVLR